MQFGTFFRAKAKQDEMFAKEKNLMLVALETISVEILSPGKIPFLKQTPKAGSDLLFSSPLLTGLTLKA